MVEAAGVELGLPKFPQTLMCRAFPLILSSLATIFQSSIPKITTISSTKIKKFYTKFTPVLHQNNSAVHEKIIPRQNKFTF